MNNTINISTRVSVISLLMLSLSSCQMAESLAKKQDTDSTAATYVPEKIDTIAKQRAELVALIVQADTAFNHAQYQQAKELYLEVLSKLPNNLRAQEGLHRVELFSQHADKVHQAKTLIQNFAEASDAEAALLLRSVLIEDPNNKEASVLYQSLVDKADAIRLASLHTKLNYKEPVTLEFRDTELKVIVEALAKGTGVNFMLDGDVKSSKRASLFIKNVSLESAIDMLVQSNELRKKVLSEDSVLIYPDTALKTRQYQDLVIRSFFLEYADPTMVSNLLKTMLGIRQIQVDERLPMIMIKDVPEVMVLAEKLIKSQDIPEPEVMLEMEILEVRRTALTDLGVTWPTQVSVLSPATGLTLEALKDVNSSTIGVSPNPNISFDGSDSDVNLLANPRIRVKNKEQAKIHIGDRVPVITSNVSSNGVISDNVQYIDTGLKLDVEPEISMAGDVTIKLNLDVSSIGDKVTTTTGASVPQIGTRSTSTELRLKDGETQVLAGLISDEDRKNIKKIPGLGDLPVLGKLFSSENTDKLKSELVLSITPHIIRARRTPESKLAEYWSGSELNTGRAMAAPAPSREDLSKLFRAGTPPSAVTAPTAVPEAPQAPQGLNIQLPPGLTSQF